MDYGLGGMVLCNGGKQKIVQNARVSLTVWGLMDDVHFVRTIKSETCILTFHLGKGAASGNKARHMLYPCPVRGREGTWQDSESVAQMEDLGNMIKATHVPAWLKRKVVRKQSGGGRLR